LRLSVADIDWTQLSAGERETLEQVVPRLEDGYSIAEIAGQLGVDADALELDWENLAARVMALSGHVELPPLSEEEFEALKQSIAEHGQKSPILRGSPTSGAPGRSSTASTASAYAPSSGSSRGSSTSTAPPINSGVWGSCSTWPGAT
jgi:hypothetical protein